MTIAKLWLSSLRDYHALVKLLEETQKAEQFWRARYRESLGPHFRTVSNIRLRDMAVAETPEFE